MTVSGEIFDFVHDCSNSVLIGTPSPFPLSPSYPRPHFISQDICMGVVDGTCPVGTIKLDSETVETTNWGQRIQLSGTSLIFVYVSVQHRLNYSCTFKNLSLISRWPHKHCSSSRSNLKYVSPLLSRVISQPSVASSAVACSSTCGRTSYYGKCST